MYKRRKSTGRNASVLGVKDTQERLQMSQVIEIEEEEVETEKTKKAYLAVPNGHREATVLGFTTVIVGNKVLNITIRAGWTPEEIESMFDGLDYIGKIVDLRNGLFVTSSEFKYIETDEEDYVTGMRKIPTVYESGPKQAQPSDPVNSPFAPGDHAPHAPAQPAKQYTQSAPQQAQATDRIEFPVERIEWAALSSTGNTTFRVFGGPYKKFGVVCYTEALQKAQIIHGGEGPGWGVDLEGKGYLASCAIGENGTSPKKVVEFKKVELPF